MPVNQFLALGEETIWGIPVARTVFAKVHPGNAMDHEIDQTPSSIMAANLGGDAESMFIKGESGSGTIVVPTSFDDRLLLKLLKHAIGTVSSTTAGSPWTHTFTRSQRIQGGAVPNAVGLSLETNFELPDAGPLQARLVEGSVVNTLELGWEAENEIKATCGILGEQMTQIQETASPSFPNYDTYLQKYSQAGLTVNFGGDFGPVVMGVNVKIDNKYETLFTLGSSTTRQPRRKGKAEISGTLKLLWDQNQLPQSVATNAGTAATSLQVAAAVFTTGDTIKIGTNAPVVITGGGGTTTLTIPSSTWLAGASVVMVASNTSVAGVATTAVTVQPLFQNGDLIKIGANAPVWVMSGGGTGSIVISSAQTWSSGATVAFASSAAKYLWDTFKAKGSVTFQVTITGPGSEKWVVSLTNVRLGKPTLSPEEGQTQKAEFPFWSLHDPTNTAFKLGVITTQNQVV
jgi:hypothetical protein